MVCVFCEYFYDCSDTVTLGLLPHESVVENVGDITVCIVEELNGIINRIVEVTLYTTDAFIGPLAIAYGELNVYYLMCTTVVCVEVVYPCRVHLVVCMWKCPSIHSILFLLLSKHTYIQRTTLLQPSSSLSMVDAIVLLYLI